MGKSIGVMSLKGGVGKTSVVAALGEAISDFAKEVLLIDGNLSAPNLGVHLNVINPMLSLHHLLDKNINPRKAICKLNKFDLIPSSPNTNIQVNPFKLRDRIKPLKKDYDVILMDSSPALNEETLAVMLASDEMLVVTTPDYPSLSATLQAVKKAKQRGANIIGLILNKSYDKNFELSSSEVEKAVDVPVMAVIPYDINALRALSEFVPSTRYKPNSRASEEYRKLAATLIGEKYNPFSFNKIFRLNPKKQDVNREVYYNRVFG